MQSTRSNDARSSNVREESPTLEDTVDAELWLNLMTSMMNFAVASTNLMKAIQDKTGVSVAYKDETKKPNETTNFTTQPEEIEEVCTIKTCEVLHQTEEEKEVLDVEENEVDETDLTETEKTPDIAELQPETREESPQTDGPQTEESGDKLEVKEAEELTETTNEEPEGTPLETESPEDTTDLKEQQQATEVGLQKKPARKTCNVAYQEKEPYKELCQGSCGKFSQSRIPLPKKRKKHKYSSESRKKLQAAREEMGKPPKRLCGCRTEECENNPCSCEDLTICAPSNVAGICVCADKTKNAAAQPENDASLTTEEEPAVKEEAPELLTVPPPDEEIVTTEEMSVQVTEVISQMCCCDEKLIDEELLAIDGDCACQTDPTDSFPDFEVSTISQHLQQTDENLEELRKEVQRISDCITGRKRYADDVAAALYREIMKPRTSIVEVTGPSNRMSPKRREKVLEAFLGRDRFVVYRIQ